MLQSGRVILKNGVISRARPPASLLQNVNKQNPKDSTVVFGFGCRCFNSSLYRSTAATRVQLAGYAERSLSKFGTFRRALVLLLRVPLRSRGMANENALLHFGVSTCISVGVVCSSIAFCYSGSKSKNKFKPFRLNVSSTMIA